MIPQFQPVFNNGEADAVAAVVRGGYLNENKLTQEFEARFAKFVGAKYAVATTSGTVAIALALKGAGVTPGSGVVIPDQTMIGTANAVRLAGCVPMLVDVGSDDGNITVDNLSGIHDAMKWIQAIVPVHLDGRAAPIERIIEIARQRGWAIVEDAAQCLGSFHGGKHLGTFGDVGAFSMATTKIITAGGGGVAVTDNEEVFLRLKALKDQGRNDRTLIGFSGPDEFYPLEGYNFKFDEIKAAIGLAQFGDLSRRIQHKRHMVELYKQTIGERNVSYPSTDKSELLWYFDMKARSQKTRDAIRATLKANAIGSRIHYRPIHEQPQYEDLDGMFSGATSWYQHGMFLPSSSNLTDDQIVHIGGIVRGVIRGQ